MRIKTKLTLGVGFLFALIVLLSLVGASYINAIKKDTNNILVANYNTLEYSRNMLIGIEEGDTKSYATFETNLQFQEKNITEPFEKEATTALRNHFKTYQQQPDSISKSNIRKEIFTLMKLNMQAIQHKSEIANNTAEKAVFWIAITGTLCFLIAFVLLVNLPANIADPIKKLSESIQQIAARNYRERIHLKGHGEFGQLAGSFNSMAEKLEEYNSSNLAKLMKEKKRIETLINNMHDPVIGLDEKLTILFANEEALKILGNQEAAIIGKSMKELAIRNDLMRSLLEDLNTSNADQQTQTTPIKIYANNKEGYFEKETIPISIAATGEETKQFIGHVIILRNITSYKELDFAKTNFIATVSHEFKTPISSIRMSLQLLQNKQIGILNQEQTQLVESIEDDANRLLKITGELLNMTQVESGNIQLSILPSKPANIIQSAIDATKTQAEQKQIQVILSGEHIETMVMADEEKTAWVITNVLSNAIRYSYQHSVVYINLAETEHLVQISVKDTGQGIDPAYQNKIFDRYFRVPGTQKEGTGLGLAISKEFIEAQGGQITVESDYGAGTTFTIALSKTQLT